MFGVVLLNPKIDQGNQMNDLKRFNQIHVHHSFGSDC